MRCMAPRPGRAGRDVGATAQHTGPRYTRGHRSLEYTHCHAIVPHARLVRAVEEHLAPLRASINKSLARNLHSSRGRSRRIEREAPERRDPRRPRQLTVKPVEGQVRVIGGVIRDQVRPVLAHVIDLSISPSDLLHGVVPASCCGLVVIQHGMRRPEHLIARLSNAEAKIDVVECNCEIVFVQSTQLQIQRSPDDETCTGYRGQ